MVIPRLGAKRTEFHIRIVHIYVEDSKLAWKYMNDHGIYMY